MRGNISEQELVWVILTENYAEIAYKMLDDIWYKKTVNYKKVDFYLEYMMAHWPDEAVLRTVKTWLMCDRKTLDPNNLKTFFEFHDRYGDIIVNEKFTNKVWPKPKSG